MADEVAREVRRDHDIEVVGRDEPPRQSRVEQARPFPELLLNLVRKELKVKYKDSVLGFVWSLARPMFLLGIYYVVFDLVLGAGIKDFAFYLFAGLIAWDLFGSTLSAATMSIVGN